MAKRTIILTRQDIAEQVEASAAVGAIEGALGSYERGGDFLPPKAIYQLPLAEPEVAFGATITGFTEASGLLTMKMGQERTLNPARGLPTTVAWIMVFDPLTGELLMICDGTLPTMLRTAAAAAVGTKRLAREDARTLTVIGAGQLGRQCLRLVSGVRWFENIYVHDGVAEHAERAAGELASEVGAGIEVADAETACRAADVIVTATNSREPIVMSQWVRDGTHLSCMGTDLHEKIECEMTLLPRCRIFADKMEHAVERGEVSQAVKAGVLSEDCYAGSLGQVINGDVAGRTDEKQITMFDGVGIGIQDTVICKTIYDQAVAKGLGVEVAFS
ncbi:MAG: hypothetical protein CMJ49_07740 [Planctomycetaceae bacterium]|nr:hypothetical protein [Planctomycetaceae bacterium]